MGRIISLNTPAPILRVDFLKGDKECFLGEITPNPGRYAGGFPRALDKKLGAGVNSAWARLWADMLSGKCFDCYLSVYGKEELAR